MSLILGSGATLLVEWCVARREENSVLKLNFLKDSVTSQWLAIVVGHKLNM